MCSFHFVYERLIVLSTALPTHINVTGRITKKNKIKKISNVNIKNRTAQKEGMESQRSAGLSVE